MRPKRHTLDLSHGGTGKLRACIEHRTGRKGEIPQVIEAVGGYIDPRGGGVTSPIPYKAPERPKP